MLFAVSCQKDRLPDNPNQQKSITELNINPNFDWKTTQTYKITLTGYANSTCKIFYPNGDLIQKVFLHTNEPFSINLSLPKALTTIQLQYMGQKIQLKLKDNEIQYVFN
ncbi:MAG TPA: hypothetical protein DCX03_06370 [Bacteroidales bacterium]|nr:hypothetical protein [Bacteroidales bacterium]